MPRGEHPPEHPRMPGWEEAMDGRPCGDLQVNPEIEATVAAIVALALRPGEEDDDLGIPERVAIRLAEAAETAPAPVRGGDWD